MTNLDLINCAANLYQALEILLKTRPSIDWDSEDAVLINDAIRNYKQLFRTANDNGN